jgi:hypothetical protein
MVVRVGFRTRLAGFIPDLGFRLISLMLLHVNMQLVFMKVLLFNVIPYVRV